MDFLHQGDCSNRQETFVENGVTYKRWSIYKGGNLFMSSTVRADDCRDAEEFFLLIKDRFFAVKEQS